MSYIKFNQVFAFLLVLSAASAFVIPEKYSVKPLPGVQALFSPVSVPVRRVGAWVHDRVAPPGGGDRRGSQDVRAENVRLANEVVYLQEQLEFERRRNAEWARLGTLRERCVLVTVGGADAGPRDSLALPSSTLERVGDGSYALYPGGVAGQIQGRAGLGGAQLRLLTDRGFKVQGHFVRVVTGPSAGAGKVERVTPTVTFEGVGGAMVVRQALTMKQLQEDGGRLRPGDAAVLDDRDWPPDLHGQRIGTVTKISPMRDAPLYAEVRVEPSANLEMLKEVMVLVPPR